MAPIHLSICLLALVGSVSARRLPAHAHSPRSDSSAALDGPSLVPKDTGIDPGIPTTADASPGGTKTVTDFTTKWMSANVETHANARYATSVTHTVLDIIKSVVTVMEGDKNRNRIAKPTRPLSKTEGDLNRNRVAKPTPPLPETEGDANRNRVAKPSPAMSETCSDREGVGRFAGRPWHGKGPWLGSHYHSGFTAFPNFHSGSHPHGGGTASPNFPSGPPSGFTTSPIIQSGVGTEAPATFGTGALLGHEQQQSYKPTSLLAHHKSGTGQPSPPFTGFSPPATVPALTQTAPPVNPAPTDTVPAVPATTNAAPPPATSGAQSAGSPTAAPACTGAAVRPAGCAYNDASMCDPLQAAVGWSYNWGCDGEVGPGQYVPMIHGTDKIPGAPTSLTTASYLMAFNEPMIASTLGGSGPISAPTAVSYWNAFLALAGPETVIISPAITNGDDPVWGGIEWLTAFDAALAADSSIKRTYSIVNVHWYGGCANGDVSDLEQHLSDVYNAFAKPMWLTEFACSSDPATNAAFATNVLTQLNAKSAGTGWEHVDRYSWFMAAASKNGGADGLLNNGDGSLNTVGSAYEAAAATAGAVCG